MSQNKGGWEEYERLVVGELKRLAQGQDDIRQALVQMKVEIATLRARSAMWGAASGVVLTALINTIWKKLS